VGDLKTASARPPPAPNPSVSGSLSSRRRPTRGPRPEAQARGGDRSRSLAEIKGSPAAASPPRAPSGQQQLADGEKSEKSCAFACLRAPPRGVNRTGYRMGGKTFRRVVATPVFSTSVQILTSDVSSPSFVVERERDAAGDVGFVSPFHQVSLLDGERARLSFFLPRLCCPLREISENDDDLRATTSICLILPFPLPRRGRGSCSLPFLRILMGWLGRRQTAVPSSFSSRPPDRHKFALWGKGRNEEGEEAARVFLPSKEGGGPVLALQPSVRRRRRRPDRDRRFPSDSTLALPTMAGPPSSGKSTRPPSSTLGHHGLAFFPSFWCREIPLFRS